MNQVSSDIKSIFIILVDISGYTRFIKYHKISLLHAEKIIGELMESILEKVEMPVTAHEILGDAISLYAIDEGVQGQADKIFDQINHYFAAFREREAKLISECSLCNCDGCRQVKKLHLKAILHHGLAAFTTVRNIRKISGEDIIISHRLLKNSVPAKEYILLTKSFWNQLQPCENNSLTPWKETYDDVGEVELVLKKFDDVPVIPTKISFFHKLKTTFMLDKYAIGRTFRKNDLVFRNFSH